MGCLSVWPCLFLYFLMMGWICGEKRETVNQYLQKREKLIQLDESLRFDSHTHLTPKEQQVNELLNKLRTQEINQTPNFFPPQHNFREAKPFIDSNSKILPILKKMPKGSILHIHSIGDVNFIFKNGTYRNDCYINVGDGSEKHINASYIYSSSTPPNSEGVIWKNVQKLRKESRDPAQFDQELIKTMEFWTPYQESEDNMWVYFDQTLARIGSLLYYLPVFRASILDGIQKLVDDNVYHVEKRGINHLYDESGRQWNKEETLLEWLRLVDEFNYNSVKRFSLKFIYNTDRREDGKNVYNDMMKAIQLRRKYSNYVVGYDLMDEEDRYHTLLYYIDDFLQIQEYIKENHEKPLPYYFHAGETLWSDKYNLFDAILLNTTRIGHGYALREFPLLREEVKQRKIALEVCPISNQMLRLLVDLRNHPGNEYLNEGLPVTISPDDPIIYGYHGVTYDYYEVFMAWNVELPGLKQLVQNSIIYSALNETEKQQGMIYVEKEWSQWIDSILTSY